MTFSIIKFTFVSTFVTIALVFLANLYAFAMMAMAVTR